MSTRPAAEKHTAPPSSKKKLDAPASLKKKSDASNRCAVRNKGNPSEPNPKAPSDSKLKKILGGKKIKDDDAAKEKHAPNKISVSKGKKSVEEEDGPSNPTKKKPQKHKQESLPIDTMARPSVKDSAQKSSKKTVHSWADGEETGLMNLYLVCSKGGSEFPENILQLFGKIKHALDDETCKSQLSKKFRRMKERYKVINNKMVHQSIKEDVFEYKTLHEKELYQQWKEAWGEQPEEDEVEVLEIDPAGDAMGVDRNEVVGYVRRQAGQEQVAARYHGEEEEEEVGGVAGTNIVEAPKASNTVEAPAMPSEKQEDRIDFKTFMKETSDVMAEATKDFKNMIDKSHSEMMTLLETYFRAAWLRSREPDLEEVYSLWELPASRRGGKMVGGANYLVGG